MFIFCILLTLVTLSKTKVILAVLGVITNLISIYVLSRKELRNTFNQLLIILAIFDILYLFLVFIDSIGEQNLSTL